MNPAGRAFLKGRRLHPGARGAVARTTRCCTRPGAPPTSSTPAPRPAAPARCNQAAPDAWVELSPADARAAGASREGDWVRVESPRGAIEVRARVGRGHGGRGVRALPLRPLGAGRARRPGTSTRTPAGQRADHDRVGPGLQAALLQDAPPAGSPRSRAGDGRRPAPTTAASAPAAPRAATRRRTRAPTADPTEAGPQRPHACSTATPTYSLDPPRGGLMPHLSTYVGLADHSEKTLADSFRAVAKGTPQVPTSSTPATCWPG